MFKAYLSSNRHKKKLYWKLVYLRLIITFFDFHFDNILFQPVAFDGWKMQKFDFVFEVTLPTDGIETALSAGTRHSQRRSDRNHNRLTRLKTVRKQMKFFQSEYVWLTKF